MLWRRSPVLFARALARCRLLGRVGERSRAERQLDFYRSHRRLSLLHRSEIDREVDQLPFRRGLWAGRGRGRVDFTGGGRLRVD
jgi:hypothetical protein